MSWINKISDKQLGQLQAAVKELASQHLPHDVVYFEVVWNAMISHFQTQSQPPTLSSESQPINALGISGMPSEDQMDMVYVIASMATTMFCLNSDSIPNSLEHIKEVLLQAADKLNTPTHIRALLEKHAAPMLAVQYGLTQIIEKGGSPDLDTQYLVDWCDGDYEKHETFDCWRQKFNESEIELQFTSAKSNFRLYIDERNQEIHVKSDKLSDRISVIDWHHLKTRHKRTLYLILEAFKSRNVIRMSDMVFSEQEKHIQYDATIDNPKARKYKSELNSKFNQIFKGYLVANKGSSQYTVQGQMSYCWIRLADHPSKFRLLD